MNANPWTQVSLPVTLVDLIEAREKALALHKDARRLNAMAEEVLGLNQQPASCGEPYPHGHPLHKEVFMALSSWTGPDTFEDGVCGLIAELKEARAALSANHSEQVREWIPVSERLPDETHAYGCHTNDVLCRTRSGKVIVALLARTTTGDVWYDNQSNERDVTHWMPLPAATSAGQKEQGE